MEKTIQETSRFECVDFIVREFGTGDLLPLLFTNGEAYSKHDITSNSLKTSSWLGDEVDLVKYIKSYRVSSPSTGVIVGKRKYTIHHNPNFDTPSTHHLETSGFALLLEKMRLKWNSRKDLFQREFSIKSHSISG